MSEKIERRPLRFERLEDSLAEIHALHKSGYEMAGNWDLSKACQHLMKTLRMSIEGAPFSLPFFLQPVARFILFRTVMEGKPTRLALKTVPQFLPDSTSDVVKDMADYELFVQKVLAEDAPLLPKHPVFGRMTKPQWRKFHAWHAAHHLSFLIPKKSAEASSTSQKEVVAS